MREARSAMNLGKIGEAGRQIEALWASGTLTGLSDSQLLWRYVHARGRDAGAEAAFRELVNRHGPMVLAVCRQLLRRPHDVDDAFQATFLVLVRRARTIRVDESLAPWLWSVAYRTARRARDGAARYRPLDSVPSEALAQPGSGRSLSPGHPAPAARGAGSPAGQVPGCHRALPPRGQVARGGGAALALADRHGEQPALARSAAPAVAAGTPRPRRRPGDTRGELAGRHARSAAGAAARIHGHRRGRFRVGETRVGPGPFLNRRSPENHVAQKAQNDCACGPALGRDHGESRRVGPLALGRGEDDLGAAAWGGTTPDGSVAPARDAGSDQQPGQPPARTATAGEDARLADCPADCPGSEDCPPPYCPISLASNAFARVVGYFHSSSGSPR